MKLFFDKLDDLHQFTLDAKVYDENISCKHCARNEFVAHGFVYKDTSEIIGKRLFCSNRSGRNGCGRTQQLYLSNYIPWLRYCLAHIILFIQLLLQGKSIHTAYQHATGTQEPRHAYRWLNRLYQQMTVFRLQLTINQHKCLPSLSNKSQRLQIILSTLLSLSTHVTPLTHYQTVINKQFM